MAVEEASLCKQTSEPRRVDIACHHAIPIREDRIEHQEQASKNKKKIDIAQSLEGMMTFRGLKAAIAATAADTKEGQLKSPMADEALSPLADIERDELKSDTANEANAIKKPADIERKYLTSATADEAIEKLDLVVSSSKTPFTAQWFLTTHPFVTGFFFCTSSSISNIATNRPQKKNTANCSSKAEHRA